LRVRARRQSRERTVSEDDPDTPLNNPVEQLDTPSLLSGVSKQLGHAEADEQLRRMRWVHQMSEYYSFEALARMTEGEMDKALRTWEERAESTVPSLPQHEGRVGTVEKKGRIFLIGSGPGHPGLLTLAAHHVLRSATLILSDKLVPSEILALIPPTTELHIAKKFPGNNEGAQNELMIQALEGARRGETVVRLKQGDPFVYGRGGEEVLYFREHGFESTVIPGVTSAIAGPEMVGIPVTQRGVAEGLVLVTGVGRAGKSVALPGYVKPRTLLVLMGVARIGNIVATLTDTSSDGRDGPAYPSHLPIAVIERASSPDQRVIVSTLANIEEAVKSVEERPPGMMVIGWSVLALEGKGRVDVLDGSDESEVVQTWMAGDRWRIREGLEEGWGEYLAGLGV
jgi:uroporphyrin-III C-methyltransferase